MGIKGAILGDIMGSKWEFVSPVKNVVNLWGKNSFFTDDTIMSCAVKSAIDNGDDFESAFRRVATPHIDEGIRCWGGNMWKWVHGYKEAYNNSWANGSAMRVSYISEVCDNESDVISLAIASALPTHASTEGIKAAICTALCGFYARKYGKELMKSLCDTFYPEFANKNLSWYQNRYNYSRTLTCPESVALAVQCVYESNDFVSAMKNILTVNCDTDTIGSIAGGIAEELYGTTVDNEHEILSKFLTEDLLDILYLV